MSWLALRDHRHGCPLDHLQTLRNIAWYAALSLRRQHKTPSIISDVRWGTSFTHKNRHEPLLGSTSRMSTLHVGLPIDIAWLTHAPPVACYLFYKCCHLPRNKTLAECQSYNLGNLAIEYTSCNPYRLRVSLLQKLVFPTVSTTPYSSHIQHFNARSTVEIFFSRRIRIGTENQKL